MASPSLSSQIEQSGVAIIPSCLDASAVEELRLRFDESSRSERNLLRESQIRDLARSSAVRRIVESVLGRKCFAVRATFFNKTPASNWTVVWHQDVTIAVRERRETAETVGFGPWTMKAGVPHVQPTGVVLSGMLALRLHFDCSGRDNGPLRVIPGSHRRGRLSAEEIQRLEKERAVECTVPAGGALLMRPLLVHASSRCATPKPRRVIHLEFAASGLSNGLDWYDRV